MKNSQGTNSRFIEIWKFWHWQYISRNTKYRNDYRNFSQQEEYYDIEQKLGEFPSDLYLIYPKDFKEDNNSEEILRHSLAETLNRDISLSLSGQIFSCEQMEEPSPDHYTLKIPRSLATDLLLAEIYAVHSEMKQIATTTGEDNYGGVIDIESLPKAFKAMRETKLHQELFFRLYLKELNVSINSNDRSRAIGLWLWDYKTTNSVTSLDAIRALEKTEHHHHACLENTDQSYFRYVINMTNSCINSLRVLTFTKQRANKSKSD